MLPAAHRMRRSRDFATALRGGERSATQRLVIHLAHVPDSEPTRVGLVVSKRVGNAVVRHRVARQLRAIVGERLPQWPTGRVMVIRALPPAQGAASVSLSQDLDVALDRLAARS